MEIFLILIFVLLISQTVETVSGFGSTVIAVTIGAHFLPLTTLVPVLVSLNLFLSGYIVFRYFHYIDYVMLFGRILPFMGLGLVIGILIFRTVEGPTLRLALGSIVIILSAIELLKLRNQDANNKTLPMPRWQGIMYLLGAGIMHGVYASGGPLLVYFTSRFSISKGVFRSTLASVWFILNISLMLNYISSHKITLETLQLALLLLPTLPAGLVVGEWLHHRVNEDTFKVLIYILLIGAGSALLLP